MGVVGAASLPACSGQVGSDGLDQAGVGIAGDQAHSGQAAGDQIREELVARRAGVGRGCAHAQDLAMPIGVTKAV